MAIQLSDSFNYKKLLYFTVPTILMMVFISIYGIVDGLFVSNFAGEIQFKAVNFIMPFLMILGTIGYMLSSGGTAVVASILGEGDKKKANEYFSLFVYVGFVSGVVISLIAFLLMEKVASMLGAEGDLLYNATLYGRIIALGLPFVILQYIFQGFFVAGEKPKLGLLVIVFAGCTNIVFDAILVILLPQEYKLAGAAVASVFSQLVGGGLPLIYFSRKNSSLLRLCKTKFNGKVLLKACINGSSEFMSNIAMNLVGMVYNSQLMKYAGDDGIAAYGVMMYVSMIFAAVFIGYTSGIAPVISYHDGAHNDNEKKKIFKKSLVLISLFSLVMFILSELLAYPLSSLFVSSNEIILDMTVHGMKIFSLSFLFMGIAIFGSGFFTALNDGVTSAIISFLRTLVFQLGAITVLPLIFGNLDSIWFSIVFAELMAIILTIIFFIIKRKKYNY